MGLEELENAMAGFRSAYGIYLDQPAAVPDPAEPRPSRVERFERSWARMAVCCKHCQVWQVLMVQDLLISKLKEALDR